MNIIDIFKPLRKTSVQRWQELGTYRAVFTTFGENIYASDLVRACIRPLADMTSKAEALCPDEKIQRILNNRPNMYMNGKDFLAKIRTRYELLNTAFIYIERDDRLKVVGFYPVPYSYFEAVEYKNGLFIKFYFKSTSTPSLTLPWEDLAVVRKDYNTSDICGDSNDAIIKTLELLHTANEGLANSIRATANLRGILKSTKAMLAPEDTKKQAEQFVNDYLNLENQSGIASLDSTQEFTPIKLEPSTATNEQMEEVRKDVMRYFGVNDEIIMASIKSPEELENFHRIRIEPFLVALSRELTSKVFTGKAAPLEKNKIIYQADQFEFVSLDKKIQLFSTVVLYGGMTINEWRRMFNMPPLDGGDVPVRRLDAASVEEGEEDLEEDYEDEELDESLEDELAEDEEEEEEDDVEAEFEALKKELGM